ncbi:MBL fold metallo-hydrolase [Pseudomonas aeruginosa]
MRRTASTSAAVPCCRDGERNVLVETGIGARFSPPALRQRYGVQDERHVLLDSLAAVGLDNADIDVVLLTHLHFDHAGGLLAAWEEGQPARLLFPQRAFRRPAATGSARASRTRATEPRSCRNCSTCCRPADRLELLDDGERSAHLGEGWRFPFQRRPYPGQMLPEIAMPDGPVVFSGDLDPRRTLGTPTADHGLRPLPGRPDRGKVTPAGQPHRPQRPTGLHP